MWIFLNRASFLRLESALVMEHSEDWLTVHRNLDMKVLEEEPIEISALLPMESILAWGVRYIETQKLHEGYKFAHFS